MTEHKIASREEWQAAREELLQREKELTRMGDELARQRRELPWVRVEKEYRFDTDDGTRTLAELFDGRSQLVVYHFMFGPSYEAGCTTCSSIADAINGVVPHLNARDVSMLFVSQQRLQPRPRLLEQRGADKRVGRADTRGPAADRRAQCRRQRHRPSWVPEPEPRL